MGVYKLSQAGGFTKEKTLYSSMSAKEQPLIWGLTDLSRLEDNTVVQLTDAATSRSFYGYIKTWNNKKTIGIMAGRETGSTSEFYYSNQWWSNRQLVNDSQEAANFASNTTTNFVSDAMFCVPISGAFVTSIKDSVYPNSWVEYSGSYLSLNGIGSGGYTSYYSTPANNVGLQAIGSGGELSSITTSSSGGTLLRFMGLISGTSAVGSAVPYKATDGNASYRPGNDVWMCFDPLAAVAHSSNSVSRVRLGIVRAEENYQNGAYSANAGGFGPAGDDQDGLAANPGFQLSTGQTNARSDGGNSGSYETGVESKLELWIVPSPTWQFRIIE